MPHRVQITDVASWSIDRLGFDARHGIAIMDWLAVPTQLLGAVTAGSWTVVPPPKNAERLLCGNPHKEVDRG